MQEPHPPLYLAAYSSGGLRRIARFCDGWNPAGVPLEPMVQMLSAIRSMAHQKGPEAITLVVRANCQLTDSPCGDDRAMFIGTIDQIVEDVKAVEAIGAREIFFDVQFSPGVKTVDDVMERMDQLWRATH